jgi:hypothetical protein
MFSWVLLPTSYTQRRERSFHTLRKMEGFVAAVLQTRAEGAHVGKHAIFYYEIVGNSSESLFLKALTEGLSMIRP